MIERAQGLILRTRKLTETSLIVNWLTPTLGRISTVAKGAYRPKSPFRGKLDLFYEAEFSFNRSRRSELHTLSEVSLTETHPALRREIGSVRQASYGAALIEQATERETPLPVVFELMRGFLAQLVQSPPQSANLFAFELKLLNELGLAPNLSETKLSLGAQRIATELARREWESINALKLSAQQSRELHLFLQSFLQWHLGKIPAGRDHAMEFSGNTWQT